MVRFTAVWSARGIRGLQRAIHPVVDFALPTDCFGCGERLGARQWGGACPACWTGFRILRRPLCDGCGRPRPEETDLLGPARGRCARCRLAAAPPDRIRAAVAYDDHARRFLLRAKLGRRRELFPGLAGQLVRVARLTAIADGCSRVIAVPSHPWATLRRGFRPADELAAPVARALGLPLSRRVLALRWGARITSKRLGAAGRRSAARGAFRVRGRWPGERVLLVDDVLTTGATVEACAAALKRAGCAEVHALVWARTPD